MLSLLLHFSISKKTIIIFICCSFFSYFTKAADTTQLSTKQQAIDLVEKIKDIKQSAYWPNIKPDAFLQNLKENIYSPLDVYEGSNTNFCGYAALTYLPLHDDPVGYLKFMLSMYANGKARYGKVFLDPPMEVRRAAGTLKFKGKLDVSPANQLWFLSLASHFKGYVNFFNKRYDPGDENTFWASVNYAKFNRMVKKLFNYDVSTRGSDLMHPWITDLYGYISEKLKSGTTVLYLNNAYLYRKKHHQLRPAIPTHYVILLNLEETGDLITMTYWDYGFRSLRQVTPKFFKKIIFGISHCTIKKADDK